MHIWHQKGEWDALLKARAEGRTQDCYLLYSSKYKQNLAHPYKSNNFPSKLTHRPLTHSPSQRLKQVRGADRQIAAAIRTHYRERLEKGKARVMGKAYAVWQQEMKMRISILSTRLQNSVLSIGAGHRQAEAAVMEKERQAAVVTQQAQKRREEESVRFGRAQEKARMGGRQRAEMSLSSSQARQREESRKSFMVKSRSMTQLRSSSSSSGSSLPRMTLAASAGAARISSPFLVHGSGRGEGKKGKVADELLEALASLDRDRKIQKREVISSFALRPAQKASRRGGGGGRGEGEGEKKNRRKKGWKLC